MRKILNAAMYYMIAGLAAGVYYREFTKFSGYVGDTSLSVLHTHLLALGMIMMLIILLLEKNFELSDNPKFRIFWLSYNIGLCMTVIMLLVRGTLQVMSYELSKGLDASISGIAGLGHIVLSIGLVYLFLILRKKIHR